MFRIYNIICNLRLVQLDELEPLFEPQPVPFSFNTPAWYVLGSLMAILSIYVMVLLLKKHNANRYRRDALKLLNDLNLSQIDGTNKVINDIRILLKQLAIHRYGRQNTASLYGEEWLRFLESKGKDTPFLEYNLLINQDAFLDSDVDKQVVINLVEVSKKWIKTHA